MARTKIVATIGPGSAHRDTIRAMLAAGMTVARINFSHGDHAGHTKTVEMLREVAREEGKLLAILGDLQGPKLRIGHVKAGGMMLTRGEEVVLTPRPGQPAMIHLPHPDLINAAQPGDRLVIGDGEVEFTVKEKRSDTLRCEVTVAGLLESRKGVNAPGVELPISCLTDKDRVDMELICELDFDYIALSFVRTKYDVMELRDLMVDRPRQIPIIAKIEKLEAIENLMDLRDEADGLMVARGDLGIELAPQELPMLQKRIIAVCNEVGKPVITATQMLQSMIAHPRPTRAEASDVANAILDGTDAVMLSGETATGKYPVESVLMMKQIAEITEQSFPYDNWRDRRVEEASDSSVTESIGGASCEIAEGLGAVAIAPATLSGFTAQQISRFRPRSPILAVSPSSHTQRRLALVWGVETLLVPDFDETDTMIEETAKALREYGLAEGQRVVITGGVPFKQSGHTNLIKVHIL
ncbi:MAG TPA: pyruvate kinase [Promineifilum sp.]